MGATHIPRKQNHFNEFSTIQSSADKSSKQPAAASDKDLVKTGDSDMNEV